MATPIGFEPTISAVTGRHVRPLHHGAVLLMGQIINAKRVASFGIESVVAGAGFEPATFGL